MTKPREWWLKANEPAPNIAGKPILYTASSERPQNPGWVHVIEAEPVLAEINALKARVKELMELIGGAYDGANG
jgi:hypothetical protein